MSYLDITITESTIKNGRIYFESSNKAFFPLDSFGCREAVPHGNNVEFTALGKSYYSDIRNNSSLTISPRKSFASYLKAVHAIAGAKIRVSRVNERQYTIDYLG